MPSHPHQQDGSPGASDLSWNQAGEPLSDSEARKRTTADTASETGDSASETGDSRVSDAGTAIDWQDYEAL